MLSVRRQAIALLFALACAVSPSPGTPEAPPQEASVRPGVNETFLSSDLDVARFEEVFEGESREVFALRDAIVADLAAGEGMRVADVGAGTGAFLEPLVRAVGDTGRVYAVEISPSFLEHLRERRRREGWAQVEVIRGAERSVELPDASIDVAFTCDTYHHFEFPGAMLASLRRALRPGGSLVVVDFDREPGTSREWVLDHVRAGKGEVRQEIVAAGFEFERESALEGLEENYVLHFRRP